MIEKIGCLMAGMLLLGLVSCSSDKGREQANQESVKREAAGLAPKPASLKPSEGLPAVVDFNATWCGPCNQFRPIFEVAEKKYAGKVQFISIDVDEHPELADEYGVQSIPTIMFLDKDGKILRREVGAIPAEAFDGLIESTLLK